MIERDLLVDAHQRMLEHFGPLGWWPAESPFEVVVGAILVQNTAWTRVVPAIENLKRAGALDPALLYALAETRLAELIRPCGTFRVKARRLRAVVRWIVEEYGGDLEAALRGDTCEKRLELLRLHGVGRETADSILLYAGGHPIFVVDAYTRRVFSRHGLLDPEEDYDSIRDWFEERLPAEAAVFAELHGQIVMVGKEYCRPRAPRCTSCPLEYLFTEGRCPRPDDAR